MFAHTNAWPFTFFNMAILNSFALPDRIKNKNHIPHHCKPLAKSLIGICSFSIAGMPTRSNHARQRIFFTLGNIKVGTNKEIRTAFKKDFLDGIAIPLHFASNPRIQRSFCRKHSKARLDFLAHRKYILLRVFFGLNTIDTFKIGAITFPHSPAKIIMDHSRKMIVLRRIILRRYQRSCSGC